MIIPLLYITGESASYSHAMLKGTLPEIVYHMNLKNPFLVYDLRTQNLSFVAPIPEQTGTTTMHFPEVSGGTY